VEAYGRKFIMSAETVSGGVAFPAIDSFQPTTATFLSRYIFKTHFKNSFLLTSLSNILETKPLIYNIFKFTKRIIN